ncbi:hypothetical protein, partial [Pseudomonas syringae]|uniref:hypothetical protein n=1 Tax=Pseudomonas syringae TaxID=317 RepID=UPI003AF3FFB8
LRTGVGVSTDGKTAVMQSILKSPEPRRGFSNLARRPYRQVETMDFAVGVFAGIGQRTDEGIAGFSFENSGI